MEKFLFVFLFFYSIHFGLSAQTMGLVKTNGKSFEINGKPYYYIGTNFWFGAILGSTGEGGNRQLLLKELDEMKSLGITNIRVLAGAEGPDNEPFRVTPALQISPGKYNQDLLDGLDFLLSEMKKRGQYAILYLNNAWDWSGGFSQYLNWNGYGKIPCPMIKPNTWWDFMKYSAQFLNCEKCKQQYWNHVRFMLGRTNRYTGVKYIDDPTIMTWEIANEPRAFLKENIPAFEKWLRKTSALIKSIDKNHLVTTGTEGLHGCEDSLLLFERIHADPNIDYLTMHIWPKNWKWLDTNNIPGTIDVSIKNTNEYMGKHFQIARKLNKPIVLEEFGLPRDLFGFSAEEKTTCRDKYYQNAFAQVVQHARQKDVLAGCNFWMWGGYSHPIPGQTFWKKGDNYLDPPVEEQGLNSVYDTDSTVEIIDKFNKEIQSIIQ
jgi:mannan endo-1,4-beta-mannosidase